MLIEICLQSFVGVVYAKLLEAVPLSTYIFKPKNVQNANIVTLYINFFQRLEQL